MRHRPRLARAVHVTRHLMIATIQAFAAVTSTLAAVLLVAWCASLLVPNVAADTFALTRPAVWATSIVLACGVGAFAAATSMSVYYNSREATDLEEVAEQLRRRAPRDTKVGL